MSTEFAKITKQALALSTAERVQLAHELWESVKDQIPTSQLTWMKTFGPN